MKLSVVLATYNEEKNIKDCLESIRGWCDEIVVVDSSSTDKTVEIAKSLGANIYMANNLANFHINKQKAIDKAKSNWILQLDADERVTPELRTEINQAMQSRIINGYWIPRKNYFLGRFLTKGGQYPDYTLRLYRKNKGRLPQESVHEQAKVTGKVGYLKNPLIHMADPNLNRYFLRFNRYTDLLAIQIRQTEKKSLWYMINYLLIKPTHWFLLTYFRHKGFMDSWQGWLFSVFSSLRFPVAYVKFLTGKYENRSS